MAAELPSHDKHMANPSIRYANGLSMERDVHVSGYQILKFCVKGK